jgi:transketolase
MSKTTEKIKIVRPKKFQLQPRRAAYYEISPATKSLTSDISQKEISLLEKIDLIYRTLCSILYNFVPTSGHPGGSISSGRMVQGIIFYNLDYDFSDPDRPDADILSYAAGHKAMGLYALWALRNELIRQSRPELLAPEKLQLRLEDLLGFRRNPTNETPLFKEYRAKALDGHPTCATPFIKIATGASGVGVPASLGLALGALDTYAKDIPRVHMIEGEGGMTPGRVQEALAGAATAQLHNAILHIDWNQASIDSDQVCRDEKGAGEYVQWNPVDLTQLHDWNSILVADGHDFRQILAAQRLALSLENKQPTAVIYRTIKGWKYGMQGRVSHGAGHKFCSEEYYNSLQEFEDTFKQKFPRFSGEKSLQNMEQNFFDSLMVIRKILEQDPEITALAGEKIAQAQKRLFEKERKKREDAPRLEVLYQDRSIRIEEAPAELGFKPGDSVTTRAVLGQCLNYLNKKTGGAFFASAADLAGSTSINEVAKGFADGFYNAVSNPKSRLIPIGGICEDAMGAFMAGLASYGNHIGVTSSYGAFIAALEHVAARLHGIGQQTKETITGQPYQTWIMVNAHAGVKTGEDGPTHADPQALQLLQECFPGKVLITLTPWDAQEIWPLLIAGLKARPAILAPFVTRPADVVPDRMKLGLPPASATVNGVYALRKAEPNVSDYHGTVVLQGNGVATIFVNEVLPQLDQRGLNLNIYYISSVELFKLLPTEEQEQIYPEKLAGEAMGITDFTLPTMYYWVRSNEGIRRTLHSFRGGRYLGSGSASKVLEEAGIHAAGQLKAILDYARLMERKKFKELTKG